MILINNKTKVEYNENDLVYHPITKQYVPIQFKELKVIAIKDNGDKLSLDAIDSSAKIYSVVFWKSNCPGYPTNNNGYSDYNMVYDEVSGKVSIKEVEIGETYVFLGVEYLYGDGKKYNQFAPSGGFYKSKDALQYSIPVNVQSLAEHIASRLNLISDESLRFTCLHIYKKYYDDLIEKPAASGHHHNYIGGLLQHTYEVMESAIALSEVYTCNRDVVIASSFLHDIMKVYEYDISGQFQPYGKKKGHVVGSYEEFVKQALFDEVGPDLMDAVGHCILSHHRLKEWGSPVEPQSIEACILHCADNVSAMINPIAIGFNQESNKDYYLRSLH